MTTGLRRLPRRLSTPPPPEPAHTQDEKRLRRRQGLVITYGADFDLAAEVAGIVEPLAPPVSALRNPLQARRRVEELADSVQELLSAIVGMLAESRLDAAAHDRTARAVRDLAQRPREPQITDEMLTSGRWAAVLVAHVAPHRGDLATLLGRALPPCHPNLHGHPSASERLETALRELDSAARSLGRFVPALARHQALPTPEENAAARKARAERERTERTLAKMRRPVQ